MSLDVVRKRCAGVDVHKRTVVVHIITPETRETRTFGTMTDELCTLGDWLLEHQVVDVPMESTGVYWKPLYNLLEALELRPVVAKAKHIGGTRAEDGRVRRGVDCGSASAWIGADELHPRPPAAGTARAGALPAGGGPGADARSVPDPEGARRGEHQVGVGRLGRAGVVGTADATADRRRL